MGTYCLLDGKKVIERIMKMMIKAVTAAAMAGIIPNRLYYNFMLNYEIGHFFLSVFFFHYCQHWQLLCVVAFKIGL